MNRALKKTFAGRWFRGIATFIVVAMLLLYLFHVPILNAIGGFLVVEEDPLQASDAIVMLGSDYRGKTVDTVANLYRQGYGRKIVFWGGSRMYRDLTYSTAFLRQFKEAGIPEENLIWMDKKPEGVTDVKLLIPRMLRENNLHSFILVLEPFDSVRSTPFYRRMAREYDMEMRIYLRRDDTMKVQKWWTHRESAKQVYYGLTRWLFSKL